MIEFDGQHKPGFYQTGQGSGGEAKGKYRGMTQLLTKRITHGITTLYGHLLFFTHICCEPWNYPHVFWGMPIITFSFLNLSQFPTFGILNARSTEWNESLKQRFNLIYSLLLHTIDIPMPLSKIEWPPEAKIEGAYAGCTSWDICCY